MFLFYLFLPCWILLLLASASLQLWSCSAKQEGGNIGVFLAESLRWEGLVVEVERLFSALLLKGGTWFWVLCWYTGISGVLQGLNLTRAGIRSCVLCSVQGIIYSTSVVTSVARKRKNYTSSVFYIFTQYFLTFSPRPFSSKKLTVCRDTTERWSVVMKKT